MDLDDCDRIFEKALASKTEAEFCHITGPLFDVYEILSLGWVRGAITGERE
jgi:hypothetical protein